MQQTYTHDMRVDKHKIYKDVHCNDCQSIAFEISILIRTNSNYSIYIKINKCLLQLKIHHQSYI